MIAQGETMKCKECKRVYDKVPYGFYQYDHVTKKGETVIHTQQPCKMCISKRRRAKYETTRNS